MIDLLNRIALGIGWGIIGTAGFVLVTVDVILVVEWLRDKIKSWRF